MSVEPVYSSILRPVDRDVRATSVRHARHPQVFDRMLDQATRLAFAERARAEMHDIEEDPDVRVGFSRHASARLRSRGIDLSTEDLVDVSRAIDRLHEKGARESLLLMGDHAFLVGVPRRTIITAMSRQEAVGSVFTQIDSTLVVR